MLTKLFILDFKHFSFWQTIFKKQVKPTNLLLSFSTWIGLLQNLLAVKSLTKIDNFSKDICIPKCAFLLQKTSHVVQSHYVTQLPIHHYKRFSQLLLNQGHHDNIHYNTVLFYIYVHWSISFGCNTNLWQNEEVSSAICLETVLLVYSELFFLSCLRIFYIFYFITYTK